MDRYGGLACRAEGGASGKATDALVSLRNVSIGALQYPWPPRLRRGCSLDEKERAAYVGTAAKAYRRHLTAALSGYVEDLLRALGPPESLAERGHAIARAKGVLGQEDSESRGRKGGPRRSAWRLPALRVSRVPQNSMGLLETRDEVSKRPVVDAAAELSGRDHQSDGEMCFPDPGRPEKTAAWYGLGILHLTRGEVSAANRVLEELRSRASEGDSYRIAVRPASAPPAPVRPLALAYGLHYCEDDAKAFG
jgi:hypothetical protein